MKIKKSAALVACLLLCVLLCGCKGGTVIKSDDFKLSNTEFSYYYWSEFFYLRQMSDGKADFDFALPLDEQVYDEETGLTWQDHMIDQAVVAVEETMSLAFAAEDAGFALPQEYADAYDDVMVNFTDAAMAQEYKNVDAYLQASYGKGADKESFEQYLYYTHLASAYADELYASSAPSDEQAQQYYEENADYYGADGLEQARKDLHTETYNNAFLEAIAPYSFTVNSDKIRIIAPEGLYE